MAGTGAEAVPAGLPAGSQGTSPASAPAEGMSPASAPAASTSPASAPAAASPTAASPAEGWRALSLLHGRIEAHLERALQAGHGLSVREYALLDVLSRQHADDGGHLQMKEVAEAVVLSQSATTRLVTRLEDRGLLERYLCPTDRRGIYTDVTPPGLDLLAHARPTHTAALDTALAEAAADPALAPLVRAVHSGT